MATSKKETSVEIIEVNREQADFCLLGESPMICNAMSGKVRQELIMPRGKKTAADKAGTMKHDVFPEFRRAMYRPNTPDCPTAIVAPAIAFKASMMGAAVDLPGVSKAQMGRLAYVKGEEIPIYGIPQMFMAVVRQADINHTPDVRTRAIIPMWAARITVSYIKPLIKFATVANQLAFAGMSQGIGDWRVQKGNGNYGQFKIVSEDDPMFRLIVETGGKEAQESAIAQPDTYGNETREMLDWYLEEAKKRGWTISE